MNYGPGRQPPPKPRKRRMKCRECLGLRFTEWWTEQGIVSKPCPKCNGTGRIEI